MTSYTSQIKKIRLRGVHDFSLAEVNLFTAVRMIKHDFGSSLIP